jgi:hypothetical protein
MWCACARRSGIDAGPHGEALTWHVRAGLIELGDRRWALTPRGACWPMT